MTNIPDSLKPALIHANTQDTHSTDVYRVVIPVNPPTKVSTPLKIEKGNAMTATLSTTQQTNISQLLTGLNAKLTSIDEIVSNIETVLSYLDGDAPSIVKTFAVKQPFYSQLDTLGSVDIDVNSLLVRLSAVYARLSTTTGIVTTVAPTTNTVSNMSNTSQKVS